MSSLNEIDGFNKNSTLREAMGIILTFKIDDIFKNSQNLFDDEDTEALHQMRVSARRFKGYLKIFKKLFPKKKFIRIYNSISDFIRTIGEIRELDVSFEIIESYINKNSNQDNKILVLFVSKLKNYKQGLREKLKNNLEIKNFIDSKAELTLFIQNGFSKKQKERFKSFNLDKGFIENAEIIIPDLRTKVMALKSTVFNHPMKKNELHQLRIKAKPLRYAMEMYSELINRDFDELITETKKFVERAGTEHDIDVLIPKLNDFVKEIKIYNKRTKKTKDKIAITPMNEFIKTLKIKRRKQFRLICDTLKKWSSEDIKQKIATIIKQGPTLNINDGISIINPDITEDNAPFTLN
jgi:CHAD domain-containing protein